MFGSHTRPSYRVDRKRPDSDRWIIHAIASDQNKADRHFYAALDREPEGTAIVLRRFSRQVEGLSRIIRQGIAGKPHTIDNHPKNFLQEAGE